MLKKITILSVIFTVLFAINIVFSIKLHKISDKSKRIAIILDEITIIAENNSGKAVLGVSEETTNEKDPRVATLKSFFRKHDSPLYDLSEFIVKTSDTYGLDFRLLPAIAMQESNVCKVIPHDSHNCWGWGIYGGKITRFGSYEESITAVAKGLKKDYLDKGLVTPNDIMSKYNPTSAAAGGSWAHGVNTFVDVLQ